MRGRPGPTPQAAVRREGAWLREQGLEPRFFCGGGWYTDADVIAAVADLGYADCTATAWRPSYLPPGSPRAGLAQPAWVRARRRPPPARAADDAFARRAREVAARHAAAGRPRPLPRLRAARETPALGALRGARGPRAPAAPGRARRARGRRGGSRGTPSTLPDRDRRAGGARRVRAPSPASQGRLRSCRHEPVPGHRSATTERRSSPRTSSAASLRARLDRRRVLRSRRSSRRRAASTRSRRRSRAARRR